MDQVRYDIRFTGRVQGVGFRYTTIRVAQRHGVAGWVRNERDGSVRCVAEGPKNELDGFVEAVKSAMSGTIQHVEISRADATGEFDGFDIRY